MCGLPFEGKSSVSSFELFLQDFGKLPIFTKARWVSYERQGRKNSVAGNQRNQSICLNFQQSPREYSRGLKFRFILMGWWIVIENRKNRHFQFFHSTFYSRLQNKNFYKLSVGDLRLLVGAVDVVITSWDARALGIPEPGILIGALCAGFHVARVSDIAGGPLEGQGAFVGDVAWLWCCVHVILAVPGIEFGQRLEWFGIRNPLESLCSRHEPDIGPEGYKLLQIIN